MFLFLFFCLFITSCTPVQAHVELIRVLKRSFFTCCFCWYYSFKVSPIKRKKWEKPEKLSFDKGCFYKLQKTLNMYRTQQPNISFMFTNSFISFHVTKQNGKYILTWGDTKDLFQSLLFYSEKGSSSLNIFQCFKIINNI